MEGPLLSSRHSLHLHRKKQHQQQLQHREFLSIKRVILRFLYAAALLTIALYGSVLLEEGARQIVRSQTTTVPDRAKLILNLVATGRLGTPASAIQQQQLIASGSESSASRWAHLTEEAKEVVPVVFVSSHVPNEPNHPALVAFTQARKLNEHVHVIGPSPTLKHLQRLNVTVESRYEYNDTLEWVQRTLGEVKIEMQRLWFVHAFMKRHNIKRVLSLSADVMLYANATEMVAAMYTNTKAALPVRWPSMQPPPLPSQYVSTSVSAHAGLWHVDALGDFLDLYREIISLRLFGGGSRRLLFLRGPLNLAKDKSYADSVALGWYAWSVCWTQPKLDPPCMAEPTVGISQSLGRWLRRRTRLRPKFLVESLSQPRACHNTTWCDEGLCVFDNSFSVATPSHFFKFGPQDKTPQSKLYEHYHAWMGQAPRRNVQFLAVNFQGPRRDYLKLEDPSPWKTWGSAVF